mgnify:CR=1 FL=1|tara:strand:- start:1576 stop:1776 length:201 start_codon:yes stop_codon:yes gene_type:complete
MTYTLFLVLVIFIFILFFINTTKEGFTPTIRQNLRPLMRNTKKAKESFTTIVNEGFNKVKSSLGFS